MKKLIDSRVMTRWASEHEDRAAPTVGELIEQFVCTIICRRTIPARVYGDPRKDRAAGTGADQAGRYASCRD